MRGTSLAALLSLLAAPVAAQNAGDSSVVTAPDRYVIDAAKLVREGGARSITDLLISRVPGLLVVLGSGLNGGGSRIRFAAARVLADDAAPLILVDGMRVDATEDASLLFLGGPGPLRLDDLSVDDIESIEVVRSVAAGAMYGPGAASGVILIHTKRGRSGPAQWETYAQGAVETAYSRWPANYGGVDADNAFVPMRHGACTLTLQAAGSCVQDYVQAFNPLVQRSPFATVLRRQVGFSGSGGPRWGEFHVAGGFDGDDGPYAAPELPRDLDRYRRWNIRGNAAVHPMRAVAIDVTVARVSRDLRLPTYSPVLAALLGPSDSTGFSWDSLSRFSATQTIDRTTGVVAIRATPWSWLTVRGALGFDDVDHHEGAVDPGVFRFEGRRETRRRTSTVNATVTGSALPGLRFVTSVGAEWLGRRRAEAMRSGPDTGAFCSGGPCAWAELWLRRKTNSLYLTEQVVVREKLVIAGTLRHDRFKEFRVGVTHPSLAVSWLPRARATGFLSRLQVRAAYASAGREPPDELMFAIAPPGTRVTPYRPDRTQSFEFGADAGFWGGKWTARVAFYDMRSEVGYLKPVPTSIGYSYMYATGAKVSNRGVEAAFTGSIIDRPGLTWDARVSVWGNRNRLIEMGDPPFFVGHHVFLPGYPTGTYLARPIVSYADANGDGIITSAEVISDTVLAWAGTPYPTQGVALTSDWRLGGRWRVSATLDYRAGHTLYNEIAWFRCLFGVCRARNDPTSSLAEQAVAVAGPNVGAPTNYFEDADYLKLRELRVSFDLPTSAAAVLRARAATLTLAGRNLLTWTGYSGADPESGSYPRRQLPGEPTTIADFGTLPPLRSWTLRVQLAY